MTTIVHERASAVDKPCSMYVDHGSSPPIRTQGHHRRPEYLQRRLWGAAPIQDRIWLCGTCHDSIHAWLDHLLGEAYQPPTPPPRIKRHTEEVYAWYQAELAGRDLSDRGTEQVHLGL